MPKQLKISSRTLFHTKQFCDDRDPTWIRNKFKKPFDKKNAACKSYIQNGKNEQSYQVFQAIQNKLLSAIETSKQ